MRGGLNEWVHAGDLVVGDKVVVKNYANTSLTNVVLTENLSATFPSPSSFSIVTSPSITSIGSSLTINPSFDGLITTNMTNATSKLAANKSDTITFMVKIIPNGFFGPFNKDRRAHV